MRSLVLCQFNKEDVVVKRLTASGVVCDKSCWLIWLSWSCFEMGFGDIFEVIDGFFANDEIIFTTKRVTAGKGCLMFSKPIRFKKGIYVKDVLLPMRKTLGFVPDY